MRLIRAIRFLLLAGLLLPLATVISAQQPAETVGRPTPEERANQLTQAEYYREQAAKLRTDSGNFWISVGLVATPLGASAAAVIAILSLFVNARHDRRTRMDTQFTETLKNSSDKDKPTLRAASAGTLAQIARPQGLFARDAYVTAAIEQLCSSIALEEDPVVLLSVRNALVQVARYNRRLALVRLDEVGSLIRREFGILLLRAGEAEPLKYASLYTGSHWDMDPLAIVTGIEIKGLQELMQRDIAPFINNEQAKPGDIERSLLFWSHKLRVVVDAAYAIWNQRLRFGRQPPYLVEFAKNLRQPT